MRTSLTLLAAIFLCASLSLAEVFKGTPTRVASPTMTIRWETADESGAVSFAVFRREYRQGGMGPWDPVGQVTATGDNSVYTIEDGGVFKNADRVLEYEVRAIDNRGSVIETVKMTTVYPSGLTSAARRTWGSIKAMFR